jgi:hypothetical protein
MSSATLQDGPSVESFFNVAETETLSSSLESQALSVSQSELAFQLLANRDFETASVAPLQRVLVVANVGSQLPAIVFVVEANLRFADHLKSPTSKTPVAGW